MTRFVLARLVLLLPVQYIRYLDHIVHGQLGISIRTREPVAKALLARLAFTLQLTAFSMDGYRAHPAWGITAAAASRT